jgi:hypothetical protein
MKRGTDCVIHSCSLCNPKPMELVCQTAYDARSALLDLLLTHIHSWRLLCYRCIHLTPSGSATASILPRVCTIEAAQAPTRPMQVLEKQPCPSARADYAAVHTIPYQSCFDNTVIVKLHVAPLLTVCHAIASCTSLFFLVAFSCVTPCASAAGI